MHRSVPVLDTVELGIVSTQVQETPNKVFIGGIPRDWDEEQIKKLLVSHAGKLRSFHLVRDNKDQSSKGYAFCEFATLEGVQMAMQTINGMQVLDQTPGMLGGTKTLNVRRTGIYANQSLEGSTSMMASSGQPIDSYSKGIFEQNISELVSASSFCINQTPRIENYL
jgi:RNA recognition motif-containing protein